MIEVSVTATTPATWQPRTAHVVFFYVMADQPRIVARVVDCDTLGWVDGRAE